jgi:hypothetical protein
MSKREEKINFLQKTPIIKTIIRRWGFYSRIQESLKIQHEEYDPKDIIKTIPPDSEKIEFHCSWVAEAYTPSKISILIKSLKELGWEKPERDMGNRINLIEWIKQGRSYGLDGSWFNGGLLLSRNDSRFSGSDIRRSVLPRGVDFAFLSIFTVTSSLTLVVIQFVYNNEITNTINNIFRKTYKTKVRYHPSIYKAKTAAYTGVVEQKRRELSKEINVVHSEIYKWFRKNLPGYFSSLKNEILPTVDLITSRQYKQDKTDDCRWDHYIQLIFDYESEMWKCKTEFAIVFVSPFLSTNKSAPILFGNYYELMENTKVYGEEDRIGLTNKLRLPFEKTMSLWATHYLLKSYEQQLTEIRDISTFKAESTREALKNLAFIRNRYMGLSTDAQAIGSDIELSAKKKHGVFNNMIDFDPPHYYKNKLPTLIELLRQQAEIRSKQLVKLESRVNQAIITSGNLTTSITNLKVQRNVLLLTIVIAVLAIFTIFWESVLSFKIQQLFNRATDLILFLLQ